MAPFSFDKTWRNAMNKVQDVVTHPDVHTATALKLYHDSKALSFAKAFNS